MWSKETDEYSLSVLTEVVTENLAIGYHGDNRPPEVVIPELLDKKYKNTASYQGNGLYCVRHEADADTNGYGTEGYIYKIYIRDVKDFFHADFSTFNSSFNEPEYTENNTVTKAISDIESIPPESLRTLGIDIEALRRSHPNPKDVTDRNSTIENSQLPSAFPNYTERMPRYILHQLLPLIRRGLKTNDGSPMRECVMKALRYNGENNTNDGAENTSKFFNNLYNWTNIATIVPGVTYSGRGDKRCILVYDWNNVFPVAYKKYGSNVWTPVDYSPSGEFSNYRRKIIKPVSMENRNTQQAKEVITPEQTQLAKEKLSEISKTPDLGQDAVNFIIKNCNVSFPDVGGAPMVYISLDSSKMRKLIDAKMKIASSPGAEEKLYKIDKTLEHYGNIASKLCIASKTIKQLCISNSDRSSAFPEFFWFYSASTYGVVPSAAFFIPSSISDFSSMMKKLIEYATTEDYMDYYAKQLCGEIFSIAATVRKMHESMLELKTGFEKAKEYFVSSIMEPDSFPGYSEWQYESMERVIKDLGGRDFAGMTDCVMEKVNAVYKARLGLGKISSIEDGLWKEVIEYYRDMCLFLEKVVFPEILIPAFGKFKEILARRESGQESEENL